MNEQVFNLKFVQEVEKHPVLYNCTLPGYSRKDLTEKAWKEVGEAVNLSQGDCKEKWKNLRAVFVRNMKPGPAVKKKKPYYLTEAMQFALPFVKSLTTAVPHHPEVMLDVNEREDGDSEYHTSSQSPKPSTSTFHQSDDSQQCLQPHQPLVDPLAKDIILRKIKLPPNDEDERSYTEYFHAKKARTSTDERNEGIKMFLLSLLPELEEMTDHQLKIFRRRMLQTIDEITNENYPNHF
uniref:Putative alcohol dehydrogenase transcription factor myb/sant-like protein n=1 Tax=Triatoma infestans TaxID=30076 RepID=A0A023F6Q1_TRIIF